MFKGYYRGGTAQIHKKLGQKSTFSLFNRDFFCHFCQFYIHIYILILTLFTLLLNLHNLHNLHCYFHYPMLELGASTLVLDHCFYPAWHGLDQIDQDLTGNGIPFFQDKIE